MAQAQKNFGKWPTMAGMAGATLFALDQFRFTIDPGHAGLIFNRFGGLSSEIYKEGWHLRIPYFQRPIVYNIQTTVKEVNASTANKDMQNVHLKLRVLFRPRIDKLSELYRYVGLDYNDRVLPSITNEVLRSVIAQYTASQLMSQRDQVSDKIRRSLESRSNQFHIVIDDVSISDLSFGKEYTEAIESKQIAQQDAERAKYVVEQAKDIKKSIIIKAQGQAKSIQLVGQAAKENPAYLDVKRINYAKEIAQVLAESRNHIMLNSDILMMSAIRKEI